MSDSNMLTRLGDWQTLLTQWWTRLSPDSANRQVIVPAVIGALTVLYVALKVRKAKRVPASLAHLPRVPMAASFRAMRMKGTGYIAIQETMQKACDEWCAENAVPYKGQYRQTWLMSLMGRWAVITSNPVHIRRILTDLDSFPKFQPLKKLPILAKLMGQNVVNTNGDQWKLHRKIAHPAFHKRWESDFFGQVGRTFCQEMDKHLKEAIDPNEYMQRLTLDALSAAAFGESLNSLQHPDSDLVRTYNQVMGSLTDPRAFIIPYFQYLPLPSLRRNSAMIDKFNAYIFEMIDRRTAEVMARRAAGVDEEEPRNRDLLTRMVEANLDDPSFTKENLRANMAIFFIAGHDTTSNALSVALYCMGLHKDVQQKARQEVLDLLGDIDPTTPPADFPFPTTDEQAQLTYLTYVIKEALRLYPSIGRLLFRTTTKDTELEPGLVVPAGTPVQVDMLRLHRDPTIWGKDVLQFNPEHWRDISFLTGGSTDTKQDVALMPAQHNYAWMPFGAGQRICLGQSFSILEQRVILAMILMRYEWDVVGDEEAIKGNLRPSDSNLMHPVNVQLQFKLRTL
ncbi:hypothetical protein RI367_008637 [Sorochytrium milnesiophthora]